MGKLRRGAALGPPAAVTKCHKTRWLKTPAVYFVTVLEASSSKSRSPEGCAPSKASRVGSVLASSSLWRKLASWATSPKISGSLRGVLAYECVCAQVSPNLPLVSLIKAALIGFRSHPNIYITVRTLNTSCALSILSVHHG